MPSFSPHPFKLPTILVDFLANRSFNAPRHGSLAYLPRKRARYSKGRVRNWLFYEGDPHFLGFAAFKAGMTHIAYINNFPNSPYKGHELIGTATILDAPPITLFGIKAYKNTEYGLKALGQVFAGNLDRTLERKISVPKEYNQDKMLKKLQSKLDGGCEIRGLFHSNPKAASVSRKKPDIFEIPVSGGTDALDRFKFTKKQIGNEIRVFDIFKEGSIIDAIGVTKGKGFQGPIKRFGIRILPKKTRGTKRGVGCIGPWHPARVMYTVPRPGQMGYHQRVEYHKLILKIGEKGEDVTPKGGFLNYGPVRGDYVLMLGSIPGPKKRLIQLRKTIRPLKHEVESAPEITYLSNLSQQGK